MQTRFGTRLILALLYLMSAGPAWADPPPYNLTVTDNTNTVAATKKIIVSGGTVGGSAGQATITVSGGSSPLSITDNTNTVSAVTSITVLGAAVSGAGGNATLAVNADPYTGTSTLDPNDRGADVVLSNGNLTSLHNTGYVEQVRSTIPRNSGNLYFEVTVVSMGGEGIGPNIAVGVANLLAGQAPGMENNSIGFMDQYNGIAYNGFATRRTFPALAVGSVIRFAVSFNNRDFWIQECNASAVCTFWNMDSAADPATFTNGAKEAFGGVMPTGISGLLKGQSLYVCVAGNYGSEVTTNFGSQSWTYGPPSGWNNWK